MRGPWRSLSLDRVMSILGFASDYPVARGLDFEWTDEFWIGPRSLCMEAHGANLTGGRVVE